MPGGQQGQGVGLGSLWKFPEISHTLAHRPPLQGSVTSLDTHGKGGSSSLVSPSFPVAEGIE